MSATAVDTRGHADGGVIGSDSRSGDQNGMRRDGSPVSPREDSVMSSNSNSKPDLKRGGSSSRIAGSSKRDLLGERQPTAGRPVIAGCVMQFTVKKRALLGVSQQSRLMLVDMHRRTVTTMGTDMKPRGQFPIDCLRELSDIDQKNHRLKLNFHTWSKRNSFTITFPSGFAFEHFVGLVNALLNNDFADEESETEDDLISKELGIGIGVGVGLDNPEATKDDTSTPPSVSRAPPLPTDADERHAGNSADGTNPFAPPVQTATLDEHQTHAAGTSASTNPFTAHAPLHPQEVGNPFPPPAREAQNGSVHSSSRYVDDRATTRKSNSRESIYEKVAMKLDSGLLPEATPSFVRLPPPTLDHQGQNSQGGLLPEVTPSFVPLPQHTLDHQGQRSQEESRSNTTGVSTPRSTEPTQTNVPSSSNSSPHRNSVSKTSDYVSQIYEGLAVDQSPLSDTTNTDHNPSSSTRSLSTTNNHSRSASATAWKPPPPTTPPPLSSLRHSTSSQSDSPSRRRSLKDKFRKGSGKNSASDAAQKRKRPRVRRAVSVPKQVKPGFFACAPMRPKRESGNLGYAGAKIESRNANAHFDQPFSPEDLEKEIHAVLAETSDTDAHEDGGDDRDDVSPRNSDEKEEAQSNVEDAFGKAVEIKTDGELNNAAESQLEELVDSTNPFEKPESVAAHDVRAVDAESKAADPETVVENFPSPDEHEEKVAGAPAAPVDGGNNENYNPFDSARYDPNVEQIPGRSDDRMAFTPNRNPEESSSKPQHAHRAGGYSERSPRRKYRHHDLTKHAKAKAKAKANRSASFSFTPHRTLCVPLRSRTASAAHRSVPYGYRVKAKSEHGGNGVVYNPDGRSRKYRSSADEDFDAEMNVSKVEYFVKKKNRYGVSQDRNLVVYPELSKVQFFHPDQSLDNEFLIRHLHEIQPLNPSSYHVKLKFRASVAHRGYHIYFEHEFAYDDFLRVADRLLARDKHRSTAAYPRISFVAPASTEEADALRKISFTHPAPATVNMRLAAGDAPRRHHGASTVPNSPDASPPLGPAGTGSGTAATLRPTSSTGKQYGYRSRSVDVRGRGEESQSVIVHPVITAVPSFWHNRERLASLPPKLVIDGEETDVSTSTEDRSAEQKKEARTIATQTAADALTSAPRRKLKEVVLTTPNGTRVHRLVSVTSDAEAASVASASSYGAGTGLEKYSKVPFDGESDPKSRKRQSSHSKKKPRVAQITEVDKRSLSRSAVVPERLREGALLRERMRAEPVPSQKFSVIKKNRYGIRERRIVEIDAPLMVINFWTEEQELLKQFSIEDVRDVLRINSDSNHVKLRYKLSINHRSYHIYFMTAAEYRLFIKTVEALLVKRNHELKLLAEAKAKAKKNMSSNSLFSSSS